MNTNPAKLTMGATRTRRTLKMSGLNWVSEEPGGKVQLTGLGVDVAGQDVVQHDIFDEVCLVESECLSIHVYI